MTPRALTNENIRRSKQTNLLYPSNIQKEKNKTSVTNLMKSLVSQNS
jgi:hypothetical protein